MMTHHFSKAIWIFCFKRVLPAIRRGKVTGDCNDYVGKGMNGGRILAVAPESSSFASQARPLRCGLWFDRETEEWGARTYRTTPVG